ncbi:putative signaling protein [Pseudosulfitobacter sp. DSM 107133]|nr:putative signaling protein [Pseudosulfitobacter sp. DSM 107133]
MVLTDMNFSADLTSTTGQLDAVFGRAPEPVLILETSGEVAYANVPAKELLLADPKGEGPGFLDAVKPHLARIVRTSVSMPLRIEIKDNTMWFKAWRVSAPTTAQTPAQVMLFGDSSARLRSSFLNLKTEFATIESSRARDIRIAQQLKEEAKHLRRLVATDQLTGLATAAELRRAVERAVQTDSNSGALLFADFDGFKEINDTYGHSAGDALLAQVGSRLLEHKRPEDVSARVGGDEFAFWVSGVDASIAAKIAIRLRRQIERPVSWRGSDGAVTDLVVGASFGIAQFPQDGGDYTALANVADARMYTNKRDRKALRPHNVKP